MSAVSSTVKDIRDAVDTAKRMQKKGKRTLMFVDEIHRFVMD
jgi:putative ATPase